MLHAAPPYLSACAHARIHVGSTMSFRDLRENISATRSLLGDAVRHIDAATPPNQTVTPSRSVLSWMPAAAQRQQGPSRMPAGGHRQQRSTSITNPYRPFTSGSLKRSKLMQGNIGRSKKKKVAMWEKEFICLAYVIVVDILLRALARSPHATHSFCLTKMIIRELPRLQQK